MAIHARRTRRRKWSTTATPSAEPSSDPFPCRLHRAAPARCFAQFEHARDVAHVRCKRRQVRRERLMVADVCKHRSIKRNARGFRGTEMPDSAASANSPVVLSTTVLPPAFAPEITIAFFSSSSANETGTTSPPLDEGSVRATDGVRRSAQSTTRSGWSGAGSISGITQLNPRETPPWR